MMASKVPEVGPFGAAEKKVKLLEQQRMEVGGRAEGSGNTLLPAGDHRGERPYLTLWFPVVLDHLGELLWKPLNHLPVG